MKTPVRVAVTGAAGQIGYSLLFRIASGEMLGADQPVILQLLEISEAQDAVQGVVMELEDCAFPLLRSVDATDQAEEAFADADFVLLVGAKPRGAGMERKDLLQANAAIFSAQGQALNRAAKGDVKVLVVGNPANTNALIAQHNAPGLPRESFTALTRLDHNRALAQLARKAECHTEAIRGLAVWGNHSATQYPDISHCVVNGKPARDMVGHEWLTETFIPTVQQRGAAIIRARGASSAASAASAALDHMRAWALGTDRGEWTSMAIPSDGSYGIEEGLIYSFPVTCSKGTYEIVPGLEIDAFSRERMDATAQELSEERDAVRHLLP